MTLVLSYIRYLNECCVGKDDARSNCEISFSPLMIPVKLAIAERLE